MNPLLTTEGNAGKTEFVTTPAPNEYLVTVSLTPDQAAAFENHDRIMIHMGIEPSGTAGVLGAYSVNADNSKGDYSAFSGDQDPTEAQIAIVQATDDRVFSLVKDFVETVGFDGMDEYYESVGTNQPSLGDMLKQLLGGQL